MAHVGSIKCPACGASAAVSHSTTGNRSIRCAFCSFSGFAAPGTKAARLIDQGTTRAVDDDAAPAPAGAPLASPPPPAAPKPTTLLG